MTMATSSQATHQAPGVWPATADTQRYQQVEQRVVGQLLQTLLYENVLAYQHSPLSGSQYRFVVSGLDAQQQPVEYHCSGLLSASFELIRLDYASLERVDAQGQRSQP